MSQKSGVCLLAIILAVFGGNGSLLGDEEPSQSPGEFQGQAELDRATRLRVSAKTMGQLEEIVAACERALELGLDEGNREYATQLMTATLLEHAARFSSRIFEQNPPDRRWPQLREFALKDLEKLLKVDDTLAEAQFLLARLHTLPGGDPMRARQAVQRVIEQLENDKDPAAKDLLIRGLVMRGRLAEDPKQRLEDLDRAVQLDPRNEEALKNRGLHYLESGEHEKAANDFRTLLEAEDDVALRQALSEAYVQSKQYDKALEQLNQIIESSPDDPVVYKVRSRVYLLKGDVLSALEDLNEADRLLPDDVSVLVMRGQVYRMTGQVAKARQDVDRALSIDGQNAEALLLRSSVSSDMEDYDQAIADLRALLQRNPQSEILRVELARVYSAARRPSRALEIMDAGLADEPQNPTLLRHKADTLLSMGRHKGAIKVYELALEVDSRDVGVLNNFSWVLATSPDDDVRDGQRSLKLAKTACELTDHSQSHILSTLAAAYAELGDFEQALIWSDKAVETEAETEKKDILEAEGKSYQLKKPWRERKTIDEQPEAESPGESDLEARKSVVNPSRSA